MDLVRRPSISDVRGGCWAWSAGRSGRRWRPAGCPAAAVAGRDRGGRVGSVPRRSPRRSAAAAQAVIVVTTGIWSGWPTRRSPSPSTRRPRQHSRRGRRTDPAWAHRRLLLAAGDGSPRRTGPAAPRARRRRPEQRDRRRLGHQGAAPPASRRPTPHDARHRLFRSTTPSPPRTAGAHPLAETLSTWWPATERSCGCGSPTPAPKAATG